MLSRRIKLQNRLICVIGLIALGTLTGVAQEQKPDLQTIQKSAESGDADSMFQLGHCHLYGEGVPKEPAKALEWIRRAAALEHPEAMGAMGYFYAAGIAVPKDEKQAVEWFRKGAEKGAAKAQLNLGIMLVDGKGVPVNAEEGLRWIKAASDQALPDAQFVLGNVFYFGKHGQNVDCAMAFPLLEKAAEAGNADAQNMVAVMLENAKGVAADMERAETWYRKAAHQGHAKAQANLGRLLGPFGGNEPPRRIEALSWLFLAESQGEVTAQKTLADILPKSDKAELAEARKRMVDFQKARRPALRSPRS